MFDNKVSAHEPYTLEANQEETYRLLAPLPTLYMPPLTTRQRDILHTLMRSESPLATATIAAQLDVTSRQINYSLKGLERWLLLYGAAVQLTPGVGVSLVCDDAVRQSLLADVALNAEIVLSAEQRRQIIAFVLLNASSQHILENFQTIVGASRTTVLKDLDAVGVWLQAFGLTIKRKANYGTWLDGHEQAKRFALAALYAGDTPFAESLWELSYTNGLQFRLAADTHLLTILQQIETTTSQHNVRLGMEQIARAEATLGMRFSDHAVLHIALALAIQAQRFAAGKRLTAVSEQKEWLRQLTVWQAAIDMVGGDDVEDTDELASIVQYLLAGTKINRWPGDIDLDPRYTPLFDTILHQVGEAYELPILRHDATLRDGLAANLIPACLRMRFGLYLPHEAQQPISAEKYAFEYQIAKDILNTVEQMMERTLPYYVQVNLAMLLRAAYIRARPKARPNVVVVCPSGMATAQLLVARIKARFQRLGELKVISVRSIHTADLDSDLILTTVPLSGLETTIPIIEVHPHLSTDDIALITEWLAR